MNDQTISNKLAIPKLGSLWPEQGGVFIGSRLIGGEVHHIITPAGTEHDIPGKDYDFAKDADFGEINGHGDWHAGDQEDLMLAYINGRENFMQEGMDSIYWSRSLHHNWPWAVVFEHGTVYHRHRDNEFRVRPFRRFPH